MREYRINGELHVRARGDHETYLTLNVQVANKGTASIVVTVDSDVDHGTACIDAAIDLACQALALDLKAAARGRL